MWRSGRVTDAPGLPINAFDHVLELLGRIGRIRRYGAKWVGHCPAHEDRTPSLSVRLGTGERVLLHCFAGCTFEAICRALSVDPLYLRGIKTTSLWSLRKRKKVGQPRRAPEGRVALEEPFVTQLWTACRSRARSDEYVDEDREVYLYLNRRRLLEAIDEGLLGILPHDGELPAPFPQWARSGYRLVVLLHNSQGEARSVQFRAIRKTKPKVLVPRGTRLKSLEAEPDQQARSAGDRESHPPDRSRSASALGVLPSRALSSEATDQE